MNVNYRNTMTVLLLMIKSGDFFVVSRDTYSVTVITKIKEMEKGDNYLNNLLAPYQSCWSQMHSENKNLRETNGLMEIYNKQ